ncbi:hypothetical protein HMPREF9946_01139 [Acetobacteraceae bacterium AT-5844]|nr:hypothetical protein HMPREF9946_01139 [Acetobacteraceae bacterium AT-5844]
MLLPATACRAGTPPISASPAVRSRSRTPSTSTLNNEATSCLCHDRFAL